MRVLLMGGLDPRTEDAAGRLGLAGHQVLRCYEERRAFPCKGLEGHCPLDEEPVDVALLVRGRAWPRPTPFDRGVACAVRQRIPVVLAGRSALNPYSRWTDLLLDDTDDLVEALERLIARPGSENTEPADPAVREADRPREVEPTSPKEDHPHGR